MTELRKIGRSDLETPPLILGGNVFGWTADKDASFAVLDAFVAGGGRMIDTADVYSAWIDGHRGGESETVIGEWLKDRGRRDDVLITTKVGMLPIDGVKGLSSKHIGGRARRLADAPRHGSYRSLSRAPGRSGPGSGGRRGSPRCGVKAGKVRFVGASNFTADRLASALAAQDKAGTARYQALQNQYNLLERGDYEGEVQRLCVEQGIGMTPYYGLASGYLTGKYRSAEDIKGTRGGSVKKYLDGNGPSVLAALDEVAEETDATLAQIALAWIAAQPGIAAPIASATSVKQVEDLLGATALTLDGDQLAKLDAASRVSEPA